MSILATNVQPPSRYAYQLGFYAALATVVLTLLTFTIAFLTPPLSGPWCVEGCYAYPFSDIASRFPRDYYWMYPAIALFAVYAVLVSCMHGLAVEDKKVFSQIGLYFGWFAAAVLIVDYFVQVSVIPPSLANGETDGIALLSQFNPHGLFIVLEEIGFSLISVSLLFFAPLFSGNRLERAIRWTFVATFLLTASAFIYNGVTYGIHREYRFEIAVITINWLSLIISGIMMSIVFQRAYKESMNEHVARAV